MLKAFIKKLIDKMPAPVEVGKIAPAQDAPKNWNTYWKKRQTELDDFISHMSDNAFSDSDRLTALKSTLDSLKKQHKDLKTNTLLSEDARKLADASLVNMMLTTARKVNKLKNIAPAPEPMTTRAKETLRPIVNDIQRHATNAATWAIKTPEQVADYLAPIAKAARELAEQKLEEFKIWLPEKIEKISRNVQHASHIVAETVAEKIDTLPKLSVPSLSTLRDNAPAWANRKNAKIAGWTTGGAVAAFSLVSGLVSILPKPATDAPEAAPEPTAQTTIWTPPARAQNIVAAASAPVAAASAPTAKIVKASFGPSPSETKSNTEKYQEIAGALPSENKTYTKALVFVKPGCNTPGKQSKGIIVNFNRDIPMQYTSEGDRAIEQYFRNGIIPSESSWDQWERDSQGEIVYDAGGQPKPKLSCAGAMGLSQLMPDTANGVIRLNDLPYTLDQVKHDPLANYVVGLTYFKMLVDRYGDFKLATLAYNMGETNMDKQFVKIGNPMNGAISVASFAASLPHYLSESRIYLHAVTNRVEASAKGLLNDIERTWSAHRTEPTYREAQAANTNRRRSNMHSVSYHYNDNAQGGVLYGSRLTSGSVLSAGTKLSSGTVIGGGSQTQILRGNSDTTEVLRASPE